MIHSAVVDLYGVTWEITLDIEEGDVQVVDLTTFYVDTDLKDVICSETVDKLIDLAQEELTKDGC